MKTAMQLKCLDKAEKELLLYITFKKNMSHLIKLYKSVKCLIVAFLHPQYLYHL